MVSRFVRLPEVWMESGMSRGRDSLVPVWRAGVGVRKRDHSAASEGVFLQPARSWDGELLLVIVGLDLRKWIPNARFLERLVETIDCNRHSLSISLEIIKQNISSPANCVAAIAHLLEPWTPNSTRQLMINPSGPRRKERCVRESRGGRYARRRDRRGRKDDGSET